jgi:hypothetical protein
VWPLVTTKPKTTTGSDLSKPTSVEALDEIVQYAKGLKVLLKYDLPPLARERIETEIAKARECLRRAQVPTGSWSPGKMQESILWIIEGCAKRIRAEGSPEDLELDRATYQIGVNMDASYAPSKSQGKRAARATVLTCLQRFGRRAGKPGRDAPRGSKHAALNALFLELDITGPNSEQAAKKLLERAAKKRHLLAVK